MGFQEVWLTPGADVNRCFWGRHMPAKAEGKTCIDCHKGIAHPLLTGYEEPKDE